VTRLVEGTFYAQAVVEGPRGEGLVDARPSDAINLALLVGAPIRVDPAVLDAVQASPIPWGELPDQLPADASQIVSDRLTDWERSREAMARAREQGSG
jgi:bifunctional DNase/RNase